MVFSFVTLKSSRKKLELIQTKNDATATAAIKCKILSASLSANNKFYWAFGDKPPFYFFKAYPVAADSQLVDPAADQNKDKAAIMDDYVHPPVWGLCEITESALDDVPVGSVFRALLPLGTQVQFEKAQMEPTLGNLVIHRPATLSGYNTFSPIPSDSVCHPKAGTSSALALTCFPGIVTGFGLYFALKNEAYYGCDTIVVTSASSKVALAFALYMKDNTEGKKVIGYTSESNKAFCESKGLYSQILTYEEALPASSTDDVAGADVVMVEVSGRGQVYANNESRVKKLLSIGNASDAPDKDSTFASFTAYAKVKMMLTILGAPQWIRSRMNPTQELFLIMDIIPQLLGEWGKEKYLQTLEDYTKKFCDEAGKWMKERPCDTEESIQSAFGDILTGSVPPSEFVTLNVAKAVAHRS